MRPVQFHMSKRAAELDLNVVDGHSKRVKMDESMNLDNGEQGQVKIDEDLHSRQLAVYGRESMSRMANANVLILGMKGLGVEVGARPACLSSCQWPCCAAWPATRKHRSCLQDDFMHSSSAPDRATAAQAAARVLLCPPCTQHQKVAPSSGLTSGKPAQ